MPSFLLKYVLNPTYLYPILSDCYVHLFYTADRFVRVKIVCLSCATHFSLA
jgi:hypothetical protein